MPKLWFELFTMFRDTGEYNMSFYGGDYKKMYEFLMKYSILKFKKSKRLNPFLIDDNKLNYDKFINVFIAITQNYEELEQFYDYTNKYNEIKSEVNESGQ